MEKLSAERPRTLVEARAISGVTPAGAALLLDYLNKHAPTARQLASREKAKRKGVRNGGARGGGRKQEPSDGAGGVGADGGDGSTAEQGEAVEEEVAQAVAAR